MYKISYRGHKTIVKIPKPIEYKRIFRWDYTRGLHTGLYGIYLIINTPTHKHP